MPEICDVVIMQLSADLDLSSLAPTRKDKLLNLEKAG